MQSTHILPWITLATLLMKFCHPESERASYSKIFVSTHNLTLCQNPGVHHLINICHKIPQYYPVTACHCYRPMKLWQLQAVNWKRSALSIAQFIYMPSCPISQAHVLLCAATWKYQGYSDLCPYDRQISKPQTITAWCNLKLYSYYSQFIIQYIIITIIIHIFIVPNAQ